MAWGMGLGVFLIGSLSLLIGIVLLWLERQEEGGMETRWGTFVGPVWFIAIMFGIVMMIVGWLIPF